MEDILKWLKRRYEVRTSQLKKFREKDQQFILVILLSKQFEGSLLQGEFLRSVTS